jgi:hypothetical protein
MPGRRRRVEAVVLTVTVLAPGCVLRAPGPALDARPGPVFPDPVVAAVEGMAAPGVRVLVDPAPLRFGHLPVPTAYLDVDGAEVRERKRLLGEIGFATARATPILRDCDGYMVPPPRDTSGCPDEIRHVYAFGALEPTVDDAGVWLLPVVEIGYEPDGMVTTYYDAYLFQRDDEGWVFLKAVPGIVVE